MRLVQRGYLVFLQHGLHECIWGRLGVYLWDWMCQVRSAGLSVHAPWGRGTWLLWTAGVRQVGLGLE